MTDGLTSCAASINSTSNGSFCCCHHCDKLVRLPLCGKLLVALLTIGVVCASVCGKGAYHCGGAATATVAGGALAAHPPRPNAASADSKTSAVQANRR